MRSLISVSEAAQELGLDPSRVRALAAAEELAAVKIGRTWAIDAAAVSKRAIRMPQRGRPLAPANAWALLFLASARDAGWVSAQSRSRLRRSLALEGIARMRDRLRHRAEVVSFRCHPGELSYALDDSALVPTGVSAAGALGLDLVSGAEADGYISQGALEEFLEKHALQSVDVGDRGNLKLRVVPDPAWHLEGPTAPEAAVGLDLLEDPDPRSKKAGGMLLRRLDEAGRVRAGIDP